MAKAPRNFDVWFVSANTVYKGVPFQVIADWVTGGRLSAKDRVRPTGEKDWIEIGEHGHFAPYIPPPQPKAAPEEKEAPVEIEEIEPAEPRPRRRASHDEDDPDMIPLIDISLVLLIFFMMIRAAGALSPVDVPDMQFAGEISKSPDTITISIEKRSPEDVFYTVRVGENAPTKEFSNLPTPEAAINALDHYLTEAQRVPDVRIACEKTLPNERVYELVRELKSRKDRNLINSYDAEVNEKAKQ